MPQAGRLLAGRGCGFSLFLVGPLNRSNEGTGAKQDSRDQERQNPKEFVDGSVWVYSGANPREEADSENQARNDVEKELHYGLSLTAASRATGERIAILIRGDGQNKPGAKMIPGRRPCRGRSLSGS